ncbi:hypothetical protein VFPFJ_08690 [Purpureocillium lilacinum]|uniref:Uncharacterized protein n=1 Tax=Purpureocillium lilacinum TaxID=33203 RepID=A0A179GY49_PURLI|nr:hypothetical protein VFPFJ_08690 [Purpureocillium lilacinum]OAQ82887.1 hypothetical protein VFPFJ_08690 [Purpureocillium lilacinum]
MCVYIAEQPSNAVSIHVARKPSASDSPCIAQRSSTTTTVYRSLHTTSLPIVIVSPSAPPPNFDRRVGAQTSAIPHASLLTESADIETAARRASKASKPALQLSRLGHLANLVLGAVSLQHVLAVVLPEGLGGVLAGEPLEDLGAAGVLVEELCRKKKKTQLMSAVCFFLLFLLDSQEKRVVLGSARVWSWSLRLVVAGVDHMRRARPAGSRCRQRCAAHRRRRRRRRTRP